MSPAILRRVCAPASTNKSERNVRPAILPNHRRHRVRQADYPAIVPVPSSEQSAVRGTYVTGLTDEDVRRLDVFEGDEYERRDVNVRLLRSALSTSSASTLAAVPAPSQEDNETLEEEEHPSQTYIWTAPVSRLEDSEWDFDEFCRSKMWRWAPGAGGERSGEYAGLDENEGAGEGDAGTSADEMDKVDGTGGRSVGGGFEEVVENNTDARREVMVGAV